MRLLIAHWMRSGPQGKRLSSRKRYASLLFPASIALILIMACGTLRTLEHAPANSTSISVTIRDQYTSASQVTIEVSFADDTGPFVLSGNQMLTCDGVIFPQIKYAPPTSAQLNRQLPGSAYQCIYTDDQGKTTPFTVPVPPGNLAITSPAPGTTVSIPGNAQAPTPEGSPTPGIHTPESAGSLTIDYTLPTLPSGATETLSVSAQCGSADSPTACGLVPGDIPPGPEGTTSGSYILSDLSLSYGYGFETFSPGPGSISLYSDLKWSAPVAVFQSLRIEYVDKQSFPIIWVRG